MRPGQRGGDAVFGGFGGGDGFGEGVVESHGRHGGQKGRVGSCDAGGVVEGGEGAGGFGGVGGGGAGVVLGSAADDYLGEGEAC